jgi:hypothetical protein
MMIISYLVGQKYFPVPYNLFKFFGYLGLSVFLYFISALVSIEPAVLRIVFHTFLLLVFSGVVVLVEKPRLSKLF